MCHPTLGESYHNPAGKVIRLPCRIRVAPPCFERKPAMRYGNIPAVTMALALMLTGTAGAATPARCRAEVLSSEELPYAPIGYWLLKATMRVAHPHGPTVVTTIAGNSPWHMTVRRGDTFWFDCERLRDAWLISLERTR
jgi:hypothetical protein